jgi:hypothetical protein
MKRHIKKRELFRKIFAKRRIREDRLDRAMTCLSFFGPHDKTAAKLLNQAAPVALDLGNGWIECNGFGSVHAELNMLSYRPRNHRSDCTALLGGISLPNIKRARLI